MYDHNYEMGIKIGGVAIPDPSSWEYEVADLDLSGKRDATGYLHRERVATKVNYHFQWEALDWETLDKVLKAVSSDKFTLIAPDPRNFNAMWTGDYYVGDRSGNDHYFNYSNTNIAAFSLKMNLIQY